MAWKLNIDDLALSSTGKEISEKIFDTYKESDNLKDFMLSDTMKGLYERAGTKIDQVLLELQDNKAFNKFLDIISKTDTGASISDAIKDRIEKIGEEYDPGIDIDNPDIDLDTNDSGFYKPQYTDEELSAVDLNDLETLKHLGQYIDDRMYQIKHPDRVDDMTNTINPEGEIAFVKLCNELKLNDPEVSRGLSEYEMFNIAGRHVQLAGELAYDGNAHAHDEMMTAYSSAFADLGYGGEEHPSMFTYADMITTAQTHIILCQDYNPADITAAYSSAISDLGFGDPDNHPNTEQMPGMMSVVQNHIGLSRDYSETEIKNMYEYASEKMGITLSDNMQDNIDDLKNIQGYIAEHFIRDKEPIPDVVKDNDMRSLSDLLKDDFPDIQPDFDDIIAENEIIGEVDGPIYYSSSESGFESGVKVEEPETSDSESEIDDDNEYC